MAKIKKYKSDIVFDVINYTLCFIILIIYVYPLIFILSASISSPSAVWSGEVWLLPKGLSFEGYEMVLNNKYIWLGTKNTVFYTITGTFINIFMTVTAAYALSRKEFLLKDILMKIYAFTMFFSGGLVPTYLLVKHLGMINKIWSMIIPNAVSVWNIIITRTYFKTNIHEELRESSVIDGCSNIKFLLKIVLPLSTPIIAVITLFYGVGHWNSFFNALIYLSDRNKFPLQLFLREILILTEIRFDDISLFQATDDAMKLKIVEKVKYSVIILSSLPVVILYFFMQKYFMKGIMIGAIKG